MAHELEPAFNPCDDKLPDDEQVFACRRELRRLDYRNPGQYIRAGREIALRQLDEIKALVQEKRTSYEFKPAPAAVAAVV